MLFQPCGHFLLVTALLVGTYFADESFDNVDDSAEMYRLHRKGDQLFEEGSVAEAEVSYR